MSAVVAAAKAASYHQPQSGFDSSSSVPFTLTATTTNTSNNTSTNSGKSLNSSFISHHSIDHSSNKNNNNIIKNSSRIKNERYSPPTRDYPIFTPSSYNELFSGDLKRKGGGEEEDDDDDEEEEEEEEEDEDDQGGHRCHSTEYNNENKLHQSSGSWDTSLNTDEDLHGKNLHHLRNSIIHPQSKDTNEIEIGPTAKKISNGWINPVWEGAIRAATNTSTPIGPKDPPTVLPTTLLQPPTIEIKPKNHLLGEIISEGGGLPFNKSSGRAISSPLENSAITPLINESKENTVTNQDNLLNNLPLKDRSYNLFKSWFCKAPKATKINPNLPPRPPSEVTKNTSSVVSLEAMKAHSDVVVNLTGGSMVTTTASKDVALTEIVELRTTMGDMSKKLDQIELYCQDMKQTLDTHEEMFRSYQQADTEVELYTSRNGFDTEGGRGRHSRRHATYERERRLFSLSQSQWQSQSQSQSQSQLQSQGEVVKMRKVLSAASSGEYQKRQEFLENAGEARTRVHQFCKAIMKQIQGTDKIDSILRCAFGPNYDYTQTLTRRAKSGSLSSWRRRSARYHMEALLNQAFFQDFENIRFERNGTHCILDQPSRCQAFYKTFHGLRRLGWSEVLRPGSRRYSASFDRFCGLKMETVEAVLDWEGAAWPEQAAQGFFVAARSIWLLHLLAFSFESPAAIFRVGCDSAFDPKYMEDMHPKPHPKEDPLYTNTEADEEDTLQVKVMVMPGFFQGHDILKCKVLCTTQPSWITKKT